MNVKDFILRATLLLVPITLCSQTIPLQEVVVSDLRLKRYAEGHRLTEYRDSTLQLNGFFLTSLLALNSPIYFRENGLGMVSSPSFRGTNASHTAVIWNGININSQLTGQVDFNTLNPLQYSSVSVRSGGGSVQYGSGAIGGSVHLNNDLRFEKHSEHQVLAAYGSFDTRSINYTGSLGSERWSVHMGFNLVGSDNDYRWLLTDQRNLNGEFRHLNLNFSAGYYLTGRHVLKFYHQSFLGDRNLSGTLLVPGRSRYQDRHHRSQLEWVWPGKRSMSKVKAAHLHESFRYYENKDSDRFSEGVLNTLLARYSWDGTLSDRLRLNTLLEFNHFSGSGSSLDEPRRSDMSITAVIQHRAGEELLYNLSLRQDFSTDFSSSPVFAFDGSWKTGGIYTLRLNASSNFRNPTFNDLYWQPGGNLDLKPERSYQLDLGHGLELGPISLDLNGYLISTEDMIRWLPDNGGLWTPVNVDQVRIYGGEAVLELEKKIGLSQEVELRANYAYTVSEDRTTGRQLIYVPLHQGNATLAYRVGRLNLFYQHQYVGQVSIIGGKLPGYQLANIGLSYTARSQGSFEYRIGLMVRNIFNTYYESIALRPMPNRNIHTQLTLKF